MLLLASVENGFEDEVLEDEAGGTPRKGGSVGTDEDTIVPGRGEACQRSLHAVHHRW